MQPLEELFPRLLCFKIVNDNYYESSIRRVFTKLSINLWVDRAPYRSISFPENIKVFTELGLLFFFIKR